MTSGVPANPITADVFVDGDVTDADPGPLIDVFATAGIVVQVSTVPPRRDSATLGWVVLAALPLQAFLSAIGTKTAEDSYAKLRAAVHRLTGRRGAGGHPADRLPLVLQDGDTGLQIILEPDLPAEAYRQLTELDLTEFRIGPLHYDQRRRRWRSERDEASGG
jgi:hypothetical protein